MKAASTRFGWRDWRGGKRPCAATAQVDVRFRDGAVIYDAAASIFDHPRAVHLRPFWKPVGHGSDIIAWRLAGQTR